MVVRFFIYQTLCCPKNSDQNSDHIFAVNYFLKTGGLNLSIIPKLLLIVDNLFDMLVEEIYAGSSVLGPKVYIPSTVKTKMNLLASFFGRLGCHGKMKISTILLFEFFYTLMGKYKYNIIVFVHDTEYVVSVF